MIRFCFLFVRYIIDREQLEVLHHTGMKWKDIAQLLNVSETTLWRRRGELGMLTEFSGISDEQLDEEIENILDAVKCGETYVCGSLRGNLTLH
jgi:hypothetical protein